MKRIIATIEITVPDGTSEEIAEYLYSALAGSDYPCDPDVTVITEAEDLTAARQAGREQR